MSFDLQDNWGDAPEFLRSDIVWRRAEGRDEGYVYSALVDGGRWFIRLNDFPDEPMFSLVVQNREVIHFNNWPSEWGERPKLH